MKINNTINLCDKYEFMNFLDFNDEWKAIYSDELYQRQYTDLISNEDKLDLEKKIAAGKYGYGSEHFRCGAAHFIFQKYIADTKILYALKEALLLDRDPIMSRSLIKDFKF